VDEVGVLRFLPNYVQANYQLDLEVPVNCVPILYHILRIVNELTVVRDLSMITLCFSGFLRYDEISSIRCKDIIFKDDHLQIKISKSKIDQYRIV
jgi:integrase